MDIVTLRTPQDRMRGVLGREPENFDAVFLFLETHSGDSFHMRGVVGALDFVFLDKHFGIVAIIPNVIPEMGTAIAPPGTAYAVELAAGGVEYYNLETGKPWVALTNEVLNASSEGV